MKLLEDRIRKDGIVVDGEILKVDKFLNHQMDVGLFVEMGKEWARIFGVENVNTEKKERLITDEVMTNMGDVEAQRFVRLNARKWACTQINDLFGLDVDVDFRSGIYIKADGFGSRNIATTGMKDTTVLGEDETGYGDDAGNNGVLNALRKMLGV